MTKKIIFQDSFLVSGIMCHQGCGMSIQAALSDLDEFKQQHLLPADAQLIIDAEPQGLGIHRLMIMVESDDQTFNQKGEYNKQLTSKFKENLDSIGFEVLENNPSTSQKKSNYINWVNIVVNSIAMLSIIVLSVIFPPSLLLTIGLTAITFLTTAFTARQYLINFYHNLRKKNVANMTTTITAGWLLSLAHTLYHAISMSVISGFSMTFMCFVMPVMLITIINGMDEVKRSVLNQSKKMQLSGMRALFPQMSKDYQSYQLSESEQVELAQLIEIAQRESAQAIKLAELVQDKMRDDKLANTNKNTLKEGMVIKVKRGECFPVDGVILQGDTLIDASILTGESQQPKQRLDSIPAGAINLGQDVILYATKNAYNSTVNKLLFGSNRAKKETPTTAPSRTFAYLYGALIIVGIAASILIPLALGLFTIPLLMQNIIGILFAVCPCTIAIAHLFPKLLSMNQRNNKGIILRDESLLDQADDIHTVVFDKTGTLTTGNSEVDSSEGISAALWQRIYLLEKNHGASHPLATAMCNYYEARSNGQTMIKDISHVLSDSKHRGLSAKVQGKQLHIGNLEYLQSAGVSVPSDLSPSIKSKLAQGFTPVYVAEEGVYQGMIFIKHEVRKNILEALLRLKKEGKKLIMLTGDNELAAAGFNQQNGAIFEAENIHAAHTPQQKESFLSALMSNNDKKPSGVWFIGDGLNDAPCSRIVSEKGGISASITSNDKAAFFTDISLNGSLDYLFAHKKLNQFWKKNVLQNQWLLAYGAVAFLAFVLCFSIAGIAVSPLIPLVMMVGTTLFALFNSYRVNLAVDNELDKNPPWINKFMASEASIGLLVGASLLLICGILITTVATGGLAFPAMVFTAGAAAAVSSTFVLAASAMFAAFVGFGVAFVATKLQRKRAEEKAAKETNAEVPGLLEAKVEKEPPLNEQSPGLGLHGGLFRQVVRSVGTDDGHVVDAPLPTLQV